MREKNCTPRQDYNVYYDFWQPVYYCEICLCAFSGYMVSNYVWMVANLEPDQNVCLECLEGLLEQPLAKYDFTLFPINAFHHLSFRNNIRNAKICIDKLFHLR